MAKQSSHSDPDRYTDPDLRDRIKAEIMAGDKGGKPGQWSARKAQMVASEYEHAGGGFKHAPDEQQQSLQSGATSTGTPPTGKKLSAKAAPHATCPTRPGKN